VVGLLDTALNHTPDLLLYHVIRANIRALVNPLRHSSNILEQLIQTDNLMIVGAEYSL
jgi:carbonic anhydrase